LKRVLQHVFETTYSFDLEEFRKKNLGQAVERLKKMGGVTPFGAHYVIQSALGGHAIPIDSGAMQILTILDLVTEKDIEAGVVPGLERAVAKNKGVEFGSLLHQFAADFVANPYVPNVQKILLQIDPDAGDRLPKRRPKSKPEAQSAAQPAAAKGEHRAKAAEVSDEEEKAKARRKKKAGEAEPQPPVAAAAETQGDAKKRKSAPVKKGPEAEAADHPAKKSAAAGLSKRKPR
jgi:endonuclease-3